MKRISLWASAQSVSITVENGARREASAATLSGALSALHPADVEHVRAFAQTILDELGTVAGPAVPAIAAAGDEDAGRGPYPGGRS